MNDTKSKKPLIVIIPFFIFIFVLLIMSIILPDQVYSTEENRSLTKRPIYDLSDISAITETLNAYVVDQFPARSSFVKVFSWMELAQKKKLSRNTYIAEEKWLMTKTHLIKNIDVLNFTQAMMNTAKRMKSADVYYAILPVKNDVFAYMDNGFFDQTNSKKNKDNLLKALENQSEVKVIDVSEYFCNTFTNEKLEEFYYKTDFHWNAFGAYEAACFIQERFLTDKIIANDEIFNRSNFEWILLSEKLYQGDLNMRFSNLFDMHEVIPCVIPTNSDVLQYFLSIDDSRQVNREEVIGKGMNKDIVSYNDIYTGNIPYYRVINNDAPSKKRVVIFKDSLENPMTDYFSTLFYEVDVIDARYIKDFTFQALSETRSFDVILFMFHQNSCSPELVDFLAESNNKN